MRIVILSLCVGVAGCLVCMCQAPVRRQWVETPYQIEQPPESEETSVDSKSCVVILGAGMTDEVFYAAGWLSHFLKTHQTSVVSRGVGSGFGTYLLVLLSKSRSPHWIEYQLSKLSGLDDILSQRDSWLFKSKFRDFLYSHFSELGRTLAHQSFAQNRGGDPETSFQGTAPVVEKTSASLPPATSGKPEALSASLVPTQRVIGVPVTRIPVKALPTWVMHPLAEVFESDPLVPSLYSDVAPKVSALSWIPLISDEGLTRVISDDRKTGVLYFPAWIQEQPHPLYSPSVLAHIKSGQKEFQQFYRFSTFQVLRPTTVKQRGFSVHRALFLQGEIDAADADVSMCQDQSNYK